MNTVGANLAEKAMGDLPTSTSNVDTQNSGAGMMKALRWHGMKNVSVDLVPVPELTDEDDAIVHVTGTTVCGSDLHLYDKSIPQLQDGDILGHEFMGIVAAVAPGCKKIKVGDRVVASFQIACGKCDSCKRGLSSMCDTTNSSKLQKKLFGHQFAGLFGYSHFAGGFAGGQAEMVRVPFADNNLLKVPKELPNEKALFLSDILCTSYHSVSDAGVKEGDVVGIWGLGPVGAYVAQWARIKGAKNVIGIDNIPSRLDLVKKLGSNVEVINFDETDPVQYLQEKYPHGIDVCIDAAAFRYAKSLLHKAQRALALETDTPEIINECIQSVKKFGTISLVADYAATTNGLLIGPVMEKGIRLLGAGQAPVHMYWEKIMNEYLLTNKFDPTLNLTHRFSIEDTAKVYEYFDKKELGIEKCFIETRFSEPRAIGPVLTHL